MELQPEWNEFLGLLMRHGVRFVLVGGLAVGVHGHERYTKDLDLLVEPTEANARRLGSALVEFGFATTGRAWRRLMEPRKRGAKRDTHSRQPSAPGRKSSAPGRKRAATGRPPRTAK